MLYQNHKVVFAITSSGCDFFSSMTRVAVASIRITNPHIEICICCDNETGIACRKVSDPLFNEVDSWFPVDTPPGNASFRNRFIKTKLRKIINGTFLFLDSDIVVRGDLSPLFMLDTDIAGARNHSLEKYADQIYKTDAASIKALGWSVRPDVYINGGVILYKDTEAANQFANEWHRRWLHCFKIRHNHRDQPALNAALQATKVRLHQIPDQFNAQFNRNIHVIPSAVIWHYYAAGIGKHTETIFEKLVRDLMKGKSLNWQRVEQAMQAQHPWCVQNRFSNQVFKNALVRGYVYGWEAAYLRRDIPGYLFRNIKKMVSHARHLIRRISTQNIKS